MNFGQSSIKETHVLTDEEIREWHSKHQKFPYRYFTHHDNPSLWRARKGTDPSPVEGWENIDNFIALCRKGKYTKLGTVKEVAKAAYDTMRLAHIYQPVSYFKKETMVSILKKHCPQIGFGQYCTKIFDPFMGFNGRMLGCHDAGYFYMARDIDQEKIKENQTLANKMKIKCDLDFGNAFGGDHYTNDCHYLVTCPPYAGIEVWDQIEESELTSVEWMVKVAELWKSPNRARVIGVVSANDEILPNVKVVEELLNPQLPGQKVKGKRANELIIEVIN